MDTVAAIEKKLRTLADPGQVDLIAKRVPRNQIIGVRMKHTFDLAGHHQRLDLGVVRELLSSHRYESRMIAISILDPRARKVKPPTPERTELFTIYIEGHHAIDTWDLVDRAAPREVGEYLLDRPRDPLFTLAESPNRWERRTAVVAGYWLIRHGDPEDPVSIRGLLIDDPEHHVQTAVGAAVRELRRAHPKTAAAFESTHTLHPAARRTAAVGRS